MQQILYNTLMGVADGLALLLVPRLGRQVLGPFRSGVDTVEPVGWSLAFGVLGAILTGLGALMSVTWPITVNPSLNIAFGEPNVVLGLLLLSAAAWLVRQRAGTPDVARIRRVLGPVSWIVGGLGLVLASITANFLRFGTVGAAPVIEPITGNLHSHPQVENTFFVVLYGLASLGALVFPAALRAPRWWPVVWWGWTVSGAAVLVFSGLNYYTHVGSLYNADHHVLHRY